MSNPIACLSSESESRDVLIEAECIGQLTDGRRIFRYVPGWYPVDSMGDRTGTRIGDKWVEDFGPENYEFIEGEIP